MNQQIKNTIYRFATLRGQQLIDEESNNDMVIRDGHEHMSLAEADTTEISAFEPSIATLLELKAQVKSLYDLSMWVGSNRNSFVLGELNEQVGDLPALDGENLGILMDHLVVYTFSGGKPEVAEMIVQLLVANNLIKLLPVLKDRYQLEDDVSKYAKAIVVLPESFNQSKKFTESTIARSRNLPSQSGRLAAGALMRLEELKKHKKNIDEAIVVWKPSIQSNKRSYDKSYQASVKEAYANAEKIERVVTDPETGESTVVTEYHNLELPEYNWIYPSLLHLDFVSSRLDESNAIVAAISDDINTVDLERIEQRVTGLIREEEEQYLNHLEIGNQQIVHEGQVLNVASDTMDEDYVGICYGSMVKSDNHYLRLHFGSALNGIEGMIYHLEYGDGNPGNTNGAYREVHTSNGTSYSLYGVHGVNLNGATRFHGTITLQDGTTINWDVELNLEADYYEDNCLLVEVTRSGEQVTLPGEVEVKAPSGYGFRRLGITDYRKVEQEVCCYVPGEVSHIENIMAREFKSKTSRRLRRSEDTITSSTETERENLTETTSTDRFEMNQEIASLQAEDRSMNVNAGVNYSKDLGAGGNFSTFANAGFASASASEESNSQAVTHAKEMTERALQRVVEKVNEERVRKVVEEFEETAEHGFDNRKGDSHVSGVYRWIDKVYRNTVLNYGKRMIYEFLIPEPAAFHKYALLQAGKKGSAISMRVPKDPRVSESHKLSTFKDVDELSVAYWASYYNVEVEPINTAKISFSKAIGDFNAVTVGGQGIERQLDKGVVEIPQGYELTMVNYAFNYYGENYGGGKYYSLAIGNDFVENVQRLPLQGVKGFFDFTQSRISKEVGYALSGMEGVVSGSLKFHCELTDRARTQWKMDIFNKIIAAYEIAQAQYDEKLRELEANNKKRMEINPGFYRDIERSIIKKNCMSYLLPDSMLGGEPDLMNNRSTVDVHAGATARLDQYARYAQFFEEAFEWNIMSYKFLPFFYANKSQWVNHYNIVNDDPLFKKFLQAGMAQVFVTVTPGYERAVASFMSTGQVWEGNNAPVADDPQFNSLMIDLEDRAEFEVEETWESRVPTSLTVIQAGTIGLNVEGLPCDTDCGDALFDSDNNPVIAQSNAQVGGDQTSLTDRIVELEENLLVLEDKVNSEHP